MQPVLNYVLYALRHTSPLGLRLWFDFRTWFEYSGEIPCKIAGYNLYATFDVRRTFANPCANRISLSDWGCPQTMRCVTFESMLFPHAYCSSRILRNFMVETLGDVEPLPVQIRKQYSWRAFVLLALWNGKSFSTRVKRACVSLNRTVSCHGCTKIRNLGKTWKNRSCMKAALWEGCC